MPSGQVHAAIGGLVGGAVVWRDHVVAPLPHHVALAGLVVGVAVAGALVPDVDLAESTLGRFVPWFSYLPGVRHRGITHRLRWAPATGILTAFLAFHWLVWPAALAVGLAAALGFLSHLVADRPTYFWRYP
jgi:membrane-bound metal-dependent hydrolase YbcI (DUF457 family)